MADPSEDVWIAMQALPRPVDRQAALNAAAAILDPVGRQQQFVKWWDQGNGEVVLRRLNG